ncbi:hypothetical protein [Candidatus Stoquefichus massiliensis]|uniref:hypothetical protein n=1 Tax=Candidatus Stoquefichus massiliensis TaxID=1470350 RepID=UPI00048A1CBF|nr:hypothetical protein [Candidatus Stoquefichus massiliensis]
MEERGRKGTLKDDFIQDGPTCGVYSLAYALDKLGFKDKIDHNVLSEWAKLVAFEGHIDAGCNPIALTSLALKITSGIFAVQFYADIKSLIACAASETKLVTSLTALDEVANECLGAHYTKADYDYHNLHDGEVGIGIFAVESSSKKCVKVAFLDQFKTDPARLHYMMIQKLGTEYYVYDSNVGPNNPIAIENGKVSSTSPYTYSGLAIVLSRRGGK